MDCIERAEELDRLASKGPWTFDDTYWHVHDADQITITNDVGRNDAAFIAESRALLPLLAAKLRAVREYAQELGSASLATSRDLALAKKLRELTE